MESDIKYWVTLSEYDIKTAEAMLKTGRYLYVLFTCQQAVEKMIKALVTKETNKLPPRIHDLLKLAEIAHLSLDMKQKKLLGKLSYYYIETRYPEEISNMAIKTSKDVARKYLIKTKELLKWIKENRKLYFTE